MPKKKKDNKYKTDLTMTVESRIEKDEVLYKSLEEYSSFYNMIKRIMFNFIFNNGGVDNDFLKELQGYMLETYNIHRRMFTSAYKEALAAYESTVELQIKNLKRMKKKLTKTDVEIKAIKKKLNSGKLNSQDIHSEQYLLNQKQLKRNKFNDRINSFKMKNVVFGSRKLHKSQFTNEKYVDNHEAWRSDWKRERDYNFNVIGCHSEPHCNQMCQYTKTVIDESLQITLPYWFENKYINISVKFSSERKNHNNKYYNYFIEAYTNRVAITYRFMKRENGYWYVLATFTLKRKIEVAYNGCIGVDLNYNLIATSEVDAKGNYVSIFKNYNFDFKDKSTEQMYQILSDIVNDIVHRAKLVNRGVSIEDLDLENKKSDGSKSRNRKVSSIAYSIFKTLMINKCLKEGVKLYIINPAYTSVIGRYKYAKRFGLSVHNAAAIVIARRSFWGLKENVPKPMSYVLQCGEKNEWLNIYRHKHHWTHWGYLVKNIPDCMKKFISNNDEGNITVIVKNSRLGWALPVVVPGDSKKRRKEYSSILF